MPTARNPALDRFRGLAIMLMLIVNDLDTVHGVPAIVKHAEDAGFHLADAVAPLFIFAIALTFRPSFLRRAARDKGQTYIHFISRYMAIIGVGAVFSAVSTVAGETSDWGALQSIGVAGLLTLLVVKLPAWARTLIAFAVLGVYQVLNQGPIRGMVFGSDHGGFLGAVSWAAMLMLCTVMAELYEKGPKVFLPATGILTALAVGSAFLVPISKNRVSASYVLASIAMCCAVYLLADLFTRKLPGVKQGLAAWWGENPMLFYCMHLALMALTRVPFLIMGIEERALWIGLLDTALIFAAISFTAWQMHKKGKRISL